jgi:hypothetical protein
MNTENQKAVQRVSVQLFDLLIRTAIAVLVQKPS